jgi:hypothetical protein
LRDRAQPREERLTPEFRNVKLPVEAAVRTAPPLAASVLLSLAALSCAGDEQQAGDPLPEVYLGGYWFGFVDGIPATAFLEQKMDGRVTGTITFGLVGGRVQGARMDYTIQKLDGGCQDEFSGSAVVQRLDDRDRWSVALTETNPCLSSAAELHGYLDRLTCPADRALCTTDWDLRPARCVDLGSDPGDCGTCGHGCGPGQDCLQGSCRD